ncbi:arginase family protein [Geodermatophilus sp. SYSU D00684]
MTGSPARPPVHLLRVPFDSGHEELRTGAGPTALARGGAAGRLRGRGHAVTEQVLRPGGAWRAELTTAFELCRAVASAVATVRPSGAVPVLLSGNCGTTLGVLAGLSGSGRRIGLVWLDAHGDFNTPEEDTGGFLDGQGLAVVAGRCWRALAARVPGFVPLDERDVVLAGARDLSPAQQAVLRASGVAWLPPGRVRDGAALDAALTALAARVDAVHLHVDLDVYDPSIAPANDYAAPDGLGAGDVLDLLERTASRLPVVSLTLASYDPALDPAGRLRATALDLLEAVCARATPLPS